MLNYSFPMSIWWHIIKAIYEDPSPQSSPLPPAEHPLQCKTTEKCRVLPSWELHHRRWRWAVGAIFLRNHLKVIYRSPISLQTPIGRVWLRRELLAFWGGEGAMSGSDPFQSLHYQWHFLDHCCRWCSTLIIFLGVLLGRLFGEELSQGRCLIFCDYG